MSSGIVFHLLAALAYATLAAILWRPMTRPEQDASLPNVHAARLLLPAAIILHGIGLHEMILQGPRIYLGWALAMSAAIWMGLIVFWMESLVLRIESMLLILLPAAVIVTAMVIVFPDVFMVAHAGNDWLRLHLIIALMAYGLITVAALQAMLMTALDRQLHRPVQHALHRNLFSRALDTMPPLLVQERLLFRLILIGFIVLSLAVISGAIASLGISGIPFPLDHKTIFTLLSWITFGVLLLGRHVRGWRGRIALRWTLIGFAFLVLAYTGTRFVLEVILVRS